LWLKVTKSTSKVVVWVQDLYQEGYTETGGGSPLIARILGAIENQLFKRADLVVMAHKRFLEAKTAKGVDTGNAIYIENWSQFTFKPSESREDTRKKYNFGNSRIVLHIGNMGIKQGLDNVVDAAKLATENEIDVVFLLVGDGNQREYLVHRAGNCKNIVFLSPVTETELSNLLNAADEFLIHEKPGIRDMSIPSKLTTYLLVGRPVLVCSEKDSIVGRIVRENQIGYWVKSGSPKTLLQACISLDLSDRAELGMRVKDFASSRFDRKKALNKFVEIIAKLEIGVQK